MAVMRAGGGGEGGGGVEGWEILAKNGGREVRE